MSRGCVKLAAFIAMAMMLFDSNVLAAQEVDTSKPLENAEQQTPVLEVQQTPQRRLGGA